MNFIRVWPWKESSIVSTFVSHAQTCGTHLLDQSHWSPDLIWANDWAIFHCCKISHDNCAISYFLFLVQILVSIKLAEFRLNTGYKYPIEVQVYSKNEFYKSLTVKNCWIGLYFGVYISFCYKFPNFVFCAQNPLSLTLPVPRSLNAQFWVNKRSLDLSKILLSLAPSLPVSTSPISASLVSQLLVASRSQNNAF